MFTMLENLQTFGLLVAVFFLPGFLGAFVGVYVGLAVRSPERRAAEALLRAAQRKLEE